MTEYTFYDHSAASMFRRQTILIFQKQVKIALRNCGLIEYGNVDSYIAKDGYLAAAKVLTGKTGIEVIDEIKIGIKGRGGAGFQRG